MPIVKEDHTHELGRISIKLKNKKEYRWKCLNPDCLAIFKKHQIAGKRSICCICHENSLILDYENLKRAKPRCIFCSNTYKATQIKEAHGVAKDFLESILEDNPTNTIETEVIQDFDNLSEDDKEHAKDILDLFSRED